MYKCTVFQRLSSKQQYRLSTYVNGAVVLVDLDAQVVSDRGEVVRLRHMSQPVVLPREI